MCIITECRHSFSPRLPRLGCRHEGRKALHDIHASDSTVYRRTVHDSYFLPRASPDGHEQSHPTAIRIDRIQSESTVCQLQSGVAAEHAYVILAESARASPIFLSVLLASCSKQETHTCRSHLLQDSSRALCRPLTCALFEPWPRPSKTVV